MPPLDDTGAEQQAPATAPSATPPPWERDWNKPSSAAPMPWEQDWNKPVAPTYTREQPFQIPRSKTQEEHDALIGGLPGGTWAKTPEGELMRTPQKVPETAAAVDAATGEKLNYKSGLEPGMRDTGILGALPAGLVGAGKSLAATGTALTGGKPQVEEPDLLAAEPMHWSDLLSPSTTAKKFVYQFAESSPTIAAAMLGGIGGTVAGGGPETPIGWATGIAGTAAGAAMGSTIQGLGINFGQALKETNGNSEAAWNIALKRTGIGAASSAAGFSAFSIAPFSGAVKNLLFQAFGVQPGVAMGEKAAQNVVEGKPAIEGISDVIPGAIIGTAAPLAAHAGARYAAQRFAGTPPQTPPGAPPAGGTPTPGTPPPGSPPLGSAINIDLGRGPEPATVARHTPEGDVVLTDAEGQEHRMTPDDVARFGQPVEPLAPPAPSATPPPPAAEPAPPAPEPPPVEPAAAPSQARTQADLDRENAEIRASDARKALLGQAPPQADPIAEAMAADQAEIERGRVPRGTERTPEPEPASPENIVPFRTQEQADLDQVPWTAEDTARFGEPWPGYSEGAPIPTRTVTAEGEPAAINENAPAGAPIMRLYRGEGSDQEKGGGWFTTDPQKAALYGPVSYVDVTRDDLMHFAQGHGGPDEWLTDSPEIRARAEPVGGAPAEPPAVEPTGGVPEPQAPRTADTALINEERLRRLAALEAENTAPETGGFVRRLEAEQAEQAAQVAERPPVPFQTVRGTTESAFIPSTGAAIPIEYAVMDARNLVTSHHDDLSPNTEYPQALQPRSQERAETEAQISGILNGDPRDPGARFRPELMGENPDAANGSPIIGPDGYVESGNARTMAIRRAYDRGLPQAEEYKRYLEAQGYPTEGIEQPVLVRINRAEMEMPQREQLARDLNVAPQATMSATDRAMADAQQIPPDLLRVYQGGDLFSGANRPFWRGILDRIAKPAELPSLTNPEGGLSPAGQTRVKNALLAKAYGDPDIVAALTEDADSNIKAIGNALTDVAPKWAALRQAVAEGRVPTGYDQTSPLLEAVRLISHARSEGRNVVEYMRQGGLFDEGVKPETEAMMRWFLGPPEWSRRYGREKISDTLTEYADSILRPLRLGEARAQPAALVENAREVAHGAAGDLFASPLGQPRGTEAVREGAGENRPEVQGQEVAAPGVGAPEGSAGEGERSAEVAPEVSRGTLAEERPASVEQPFFSALTRAVEAIPQPKAPGAQWANLIRNLSQKGVKQDEINWAGVMDWLGEHPGVVTKEQLLDELRANEVRIEEVQHGTPTEAPDIAAKRERFQELQDKLARTNEALSPEEEAEARTLLADLQGPNPWLSHTQGRYPDYTLPGGSNYRELLLTLPNEVAYPDRAELALKMFGQDYGELTGTQKAEVENAARSQDRSQTYRTGHWEEPNVLAHIRMDDRTDAEGRKVLHVAEIQSDWHQQGRRRGYQGDRTPDQETGKWSVIQTNPDGTTVPYGNLETRENAETWAERVREAGREARVEPEVIRGVEKAGTVPRAPLRTQWPELAMKRVLRYAAENGYDRVSWDTGETQAARYDLSKHISDLTLHGIGDNLRLSATNLDNRRVIDMQHTTREGLTDLVGKDAADKLLSQPDPDPNNPSAARSLHGLDLKVGGEGMKGFYDRILPAFLNKYAKKWGARVERGEVQSGTSRYNYEGPDPMSDGAALAKIDFYARNNVGAGQQWRAVERAYNRGVPFAEAMSEHGSSYMAELVGGRMVERPAHTDAHVIDITDQMRESVMRGQALWQGEGARSQPEPARSMVDDFLRVRRENYPEGVAGSHQAARDFVRTLGNATGHEYFGGVDTRDGMIVDAGTSNHPSQISFNDETLRRMWDPNGTPVDYHHNHPSNYPLSTPDIGMLAAPNLRTVIAHGDDGSLYAARLTPEAQAWIDGMSPREGQDALYLLSHKAGDIVENALNGMVESGRITRDQADGWVREGTNQALAAAGVIDYMSPHEIPAMIHPWIARAARMLSDSTGKNQIERASVPWKADPEAIVDRIYRSARAVSPEEGMGRLSQSDEGAAAGRPAGPGGDEGGARGAEPPAQPEGRLAEERPDPTIEQSRDFIDDAIEEPIRRAEDILGPPRRPPPPGYTGRVLKLFGMGRGSPGRDERWMNPAEKLGTAPSNMARYDMGGVSAQKFAAEEGLRLRKETLRSNYAADLADLLKLPKADQEKIASAQELARLQGRQIPTDGRAIILENAERGSDTDPLAHQPLAQRSRPGDVIRLDTPELIAGFTAARAAFDHMYSDRIAATSRAHGWDGPPTAAAIAEYADSLRDDSPGPARHWDLISKIVGLTEYARRNAYVPFMRPSGAEGDYYFRVVPKEGTPDKPGVPGWTGDGYPPTVWYSRIASRLPEERIMGGNRTSSATVDAYRAELRKAFPEGEYDIQDGYHHPSEDKLRDMDISSIEDLFQIVSLDFKREWRDRIRTSDNPEAEKAAAEKAQELHDEAIHSFLDAMYEKMKAGFRKQALNIPGYEPDLLKVTSIYTNWLASHNAELEHRVVIEAADRAVDGSYDPLTRDAWHQIDRDMDAQKGVLDFGLGKLRQGAFYWMLGGNLASTIKVLLHGPMLGYSVLSTGLGGMGRMDAARIYGGAFKDVMKTLGADTQRGIKVDPLGAATTPAERALVERNLANDRLHGAAAKEELGAIRQQGIEAYSPQQSFARRVLAIWSSNISVADSTIRTAMMLAAYRIAQQPGAMDKINRTWGRDALWAQEPQKTPEAWAEFMTDRTAGIWGKTNKSEVARSMLGGALLQFRSYELNFLSALHQQMYHMGPEGKVSALMMLSSLGMMAGALGLPFSQDIEKAYEWVHKTLTGIDPNLNEHFLQFMEQDPMGLGSQAGQSVLYGMEPLGIDIGPGLSFGDALSRNARSPLDALGPAASIFAGGPMRAMQRSGQSYTAQAAELMPNAIKNLTRAFGVYPEEGVKSASGKVVVKPEALSGGDLAMVGAGLRPVTVGDPYRRNERVYRIEEAAKSEKAALDRKIGALTQSATQARARGDTATAQAYQARIDSAIAGASVGAKQIIAAEKRATMQATNPDMAAIKGAPKAVRGPVGQIYGQP